MTGEETTWEGLMTEVLGKRNSVRVCKYRGIYIRGRRTLALLTNPSRVYLLHNSVFSSLGFPDRETQVKRLPFVESFSRIAIGDLNLSYDKKFLFFNNRKWECPLSVLRVPTIEALGALNEDLLRTRRDRVSLNRKRQVASLLEDIDALTLRIQEESNPTLISQLYGSLKKIRVKLERAKALPLNTPPVRTTSNNKKKRTLRSIEYLGTVISFGRNQKQNSRLYRVSREKDLNWVFLHVGGSIPGSTVIIQNPTPSREVLKFASFLAAMYSKAWDGGLSRVLVNYCGLKQVTETDVLARYLVRDPEVLEIDLVASVLPYEPYFDTSMVKKPIGIISSGGLKKEHHLGSLKGFLNERVLELLPTRFNLVMFSSDD